MEWSSRQLTYEQLLAENSELKATVSHLNAELAQLRRMIFGQKRERFVPLVNEHQLAFSVNDHGSVGHASKIRADCAPFVRSRSRPRAGARSGCSMIEMVRLSDIDSVLRGDEMGRFAKGHKKEESKLPPLSKAGRGVLAEARTAMRRGLAVTITITVPAGEGRAAAAAQAQHVAGGGLHAGAGGGLVPGEHEHTAPEGSYPPIRKGESMRDWIERVGYKPTS